MNNSLVPQYYTVQDMPNGQRWVYPLSDSVYAPGIHTVTSPGGMVQIHKGHMIADHPLGEVTTFGQPGSVLSHATIRDQSYVSEKFPTTLTAADWKGRCECSDDGDCTWCEVRYTFYELHHVDAPGKQSTLDFSDYVFLPSSVDPNPELPWTVGVHQTVLFGDAFHHLRPGSIPAIRNMLQRSLEQLPNVDKVYDSRDFSVYVSMSWSEPKTEHRPRIGHNGRKLKGTTEKVVETISKSYDISVPYAITGETKAEAVAKWIALRDKWVIFFTEANVTACSHCDGYGYIAPRLPR